ncbi:HesA/MoeB/ThiF family protein [Paracoccus sp. Z118]|uniref:HesA/MoeB/ThiF family protein n=1 Tax=Paracoccus sp. Z118 TaxID=2851017 RepID=UPI001C2BAB75|nr:HesA/MoeB/ThiF family protein [Paracoccus sp. Z118]MBV0891998.1 HesA/MoeB/ThiF family protein [Paracoccus sp. Z118]
MGGILVIAVLVLAARVAGWRGARLAAALALAWAAVMAVALLAPASMAGRWVGVSPRVWAALGVLGAIAIAYAAVVGWARRNAREPGNPVPATPSVPAPNDPPPNDPAAPLTDAELDRYARHIVLRELGGQGQRALKAARVLVVGAGGLGSPLLLYLAAAGVGRITVADDDTVGLSNLQRQVMFTTADIGRPKIEAAADAIARLNPHIAVTALPRRITAADAELIAAHDLVLDGTDSFAVRAEVNAVCVAAATPLIAGSIAQWEGQVALYDPARGGPCMACIFPEAPAPGLAPSCAEAGVVGALPGVVGGMMAIEAIKLLAGITRRGTGAGLRGQMILFDGLWGETRRLDIPARADCPVCGGRGLHATEGQTP